MSDQRVRISSGSAFEEQIGYSRAIVAGDWVFVSGTTGYDYAAGALPEGVIAQCEQAFVNIGHALAEAGADFEDVVRVHYYLADAADFEACWPITRRHFGDVRPAATMLQVPLMEQAMRIEIEVTALKRS